MKNWNFFCRTFCRTFLPDGVCNPVRDVFRITADEPLPAKWDDAGHFQMMEEPEKFNDLLSDFINKNVQSVQQDAHPLKTDHYDFKNK